MFLLNNTDDFHETLLSVLSINLYFFVYADFLLQVKSYSSAPDLIKTPESLGDAEQSLH